MHDRLQKAAEARVKTGRWAATLIGGFNDIFITVGIALPLKPLPTPFRLTFLLPIRSDP